MDHNTPTNNIKTCDLSQKTKAELFDIVSKLPPPIESCSAKDTLFGWADDGKGVWVLPASKENFERFEEIAKLKPNMGHDSNEVHCEIMKEAGAEFFKDWRDSDRARGVKEMREGSG
jgi:hypothetical protein